MRATEATWNHFWMLHVFVLIDLSSRRNDSITITRSEVVHKLRTVKIDSLIAYWLDFWPLAIYNVLVLDRKYLDTSNNMECDFVWSPSKYNSNWWKRSFWKMSDLIFVNSTKCWTILWMIMIDLNLLACLYMSRTLSVSRILNHSWEFHKRKPPIMICLRHTLNTHMATDLPVNQPPYAIHFKQ